MFQKPETFSELINYKKVPGIIFQLFLIIIFQKAISSKVKNKIIRVIIAFILSEIIMTIIAKLIGMFTIGGDSVNISIVQLLIYKLFNYSLVTIPPIEIQI